ncbi:MAG: Coenzyme F420 hydrogenase/dehydrogenase, beta subunit C-terminal domain [Rikenellaceae bacterium]
MKIFEDKKECCGCGACANICPKAAIEMRPDALGFLYPEVNAELCVECGLCLKVCAFKPGYDRSDNLDTPKLFAVRHKDIKEVEASRSGAMFVAVSNWILSRGGVIYGVGYSDHFRAVHKRATSAQERDEFRGSKYVQSDTNSTFTGVLSDLNDGLYVLFSGTPCQCAGLRCFLRLRGADFSRLYVVDIVCHGVPSPYVWRDYLSLVEGKQGAKATAVDFRDKRKFGWIAHKESFSFEGAYAYSSTYTFLFSEHIMFRHSCGVCYFTNFVRPSDLTLGDFWGWQKAVGRGFNSDDKGISLVFLNTAKGAELFEEVNTELNYTKTTQQLCAQHNLHSPSVINPRREKFEKDYTSKGILYVCKKYGDLGWQNRIKILGRQINAFFYRKVAGTWKRIF